MLANYIAQTHYNLRLTKVDTCSIATLLDKMKPSIAHDIQYEKQYNKNLYLHNKPSSVIKCKYYAIALLITLKMNLDVPKNNAYYAQALKIELKQLNNYEINFLKLLEWNATISEIEFNKKSLLYDEMNGDYVNLILTSMNHHVLTNNNTLINMRNLIDFDSGNNPLINNGLKMFNSGTTIICDNLAALGTNLAAMYISFVFFVYKVSGK